MTANPPKLETLEDLSLLRESVDLECKLAQGQNGQGEIPKDFWPTYSAMAKVSANLLSDAEVEELVVDGKTILAIRIPQATRKQKPVFLHGQPLGNSYRRLNDGDRKCDDETVKRACWPSSWRTAGAPVVEHGRRRIFAADRRLARRPCER